MIKRLVILIVLCGSCYYQGQASQQKQDDPNSGFFYGTGYSFVLTAPNQWVLDDKAGASQGLVAVLYPNGSSWKDAVAAIYVRVVQKAAGKATVKQIVDADISDFSQASAKSTAKDAQSIETRDNKECAVKLFHDARYNNDEIVAYIDEPTVVVIVVLTSRKETEFRKSRPAFVDLVRSYHFIGSPTLPNQHQD